VRALRSCAPSVYAAILEALQESRRLRISYLRRDARTKREHEVEPQELQLSDGLVYLRARLPRKKRLVTFLLDRISKAKVLETGFRLKRLKRTAFGVFEGPPESVEVRFSAELANCIAGRRWHATQKLVTNADGTLVFTARLSGMHEFVGWVMSWGSHAELVSPPAWREEIERRALDIARLHKAQIAKTHDPSP
jgi:proteasome accessory factor B